MDIQQLQDCIEFIRAYEYIFTGHKILIDNSHLKRVAEINKVVPVEYSKRAMIDFLSVGTVPTFAEIRKHGAELQQADRRRKHK